MTAVGWVFEGRRRFELAQRLGRIAQRPFLRNGTIKRLPGPLGGWTTTRDLRPLAGQSFRDWWRERPVSSAREVILGRIRLALAVARPPSRSRATTAGPETSIDRRSSSVCASGSATTARRSAGSLPPSSRGNRAGSRVSRSATRIGDPGRDPGGLASESGSS